MAAVAAFAPPACCRFAQENAFRIFVDNSRSGQIDRCRRIVDEENIPVEVRECPSVHGKRCKPLVRVSRHGLVDHDCLIPLGLVAVLRDIVRCQVHVVEGD